MSEITTILNGFKRPQFLKEQINSVLNQTIKPVDIMLWQNSDEGFDTSLTNTLTTANCNKNLGVWARFAFALNAKTEYICIFDDDTIPGSKWFENCLNTMKTNEGLLGTIGLVFNSDKSYFPHIRHGWATPNENVVEVDIVGHAWFFKREWLSTFWRELPPPNLTIVGEDMHFSYMLQKYLNIKTFVPSHPINDKELWGSLKGWEMGTERNALSFNQNNINLMDSYYKDLINKGFKIINS
jgi:hypothetical protein